MRDIKQTRKKISKRNGTETMAPYLILSCVAPKQRSACSGYRRKGQFSLWFSERQCAYARRMSHFIRKYFHNRLMKIYTFGSAGEWHCEVANAISDSDLIVFISHIQIQHILSTDWASFIHLHAFIVRLSFNGHRPFIHSSITLIHLCTHSTHSTHSHVTHTTHTSDFQFNKIRPIRPQVQHSPTSESKSLSIWKYDSFRSCCLFVRFADENDFEYFCNLFHIK